MEKLGRGAWLQRLEALGDRNGWFDVLGNGYFLLHLEGNSKTLLVTFEDVGKVRRLSADGCPLGGKLAAMWGWSSLSIMSDEERWFRDEVIYDTFDRLEAEGFFEGFERVVFYGAGPSNAYAAAAYSVTSPGAVVFLIEPQATLERTLTNWDNRFPDMRRTDFRSRYGYAPDMVEAAQRVFVLHDPSIALDAVHAMLFRSDHATLVRLRGTGGLCEEALINMGIIGKIVGLAASGHLKDLTIYKLFRARRNETRWLERFAQKLQRWNRPFMLALACRSILRRRPSNEIERLYVGAESALRAKGRDLPPIRAYSAGLPKGMRAKRPTGSGPSSPLGP